MYEGRPSQVYKLVPSIHGKVGKCRHLVVVEIVSGRVCIPPAGSDKGFKTLSLPGRGTRGHLHVA